MIDWDNQKGVNLYHADCMDLMKSMPDNWVDLAICDPPYGIGVAKTGAIGGTRKGLNKKWANESVREFDKKDWDDKAPDQSYFMELKRVSRNQIIWGGNYFTDNLLPTNSWIFWYKEPNSNNLTFSDGELAWTSFNKVLKQVSIPWIGFGSVNLKETKIHICQKPVKLYDWLLANYAKEGDRILDTHGGSFSSAIAAHYGGFDYVGMELDSDYYKDGCERFERETAQQDMFTGGAN